MTRPLILMACILALVVGCGAGNGNGHERHGNGHDRYEDDDIVHTRSAPSASMSMSMSMSTSDGKWWCLDLERPGPADGASACVRTESYCNKLRGFIDEQGRAPTACRPQTSAFCFTYQLDGKWKERCLKTGPQCEELHDKLRKHSEITGTRPCAEQKNDTPPSGGSL